MQKDQAPNQIFVIDQRIENYQALLQAVEDQGMKTILLHPERDGMSQLLQALEGYDDIQGLHIFSHAAPGSLQLGSTLLNQASLANHADLFSQLGLKLSDSGDLLFYGCELALGDEGDAFIQSVAELTGADVAASDDITGFGGNWLLEKQIGKIESSFDSAQVEDTHVTLAITEDTVHTYSSNTWAHASLATDSTGKAYLLHKIDSYNLVLKSWNGSAWVDEHQISTADTGNTSFSDDLDISIDGNNNIHIVYRPSDGSTIDNTRGIGYGKYDGNSWSFGWVDNASHPSGWRNFDDPVLAVDNAGIAHLMFDYSDENGDYVKYATNASGSWAFETLTTGTGGQDEVFSHDLKIDANGDIHAFYQQEDDQNDYGANLYYKVKSGGTWSAGQKIVDNSGDLKYYYVSNIAMDSSGNSHLVYSADTYDGGGALVSSDSYYLTNAGGSWISQQMLQSSSRSEWVPFLTEHQGDIYALKDSWTSDWSSSYQQLGILQSGAGTWDFSNSTQFTLPYGGDPGTLYDFVIGANGEVTFVTEDSGLRNIFSENGLISDYITPSGPTSTITLSGSPAETDDSVSYTVVFSESVTGVSIDDFALTTTGNATGNIASVTGSGTTYTLTVDTITGEGTLRLDLKGGTNIQNGTGNAPEADSSGTIHDVDHVAPTVTSGNISLSGATGTGGAFKVGDTVTATWNNTAGGDNNSDTISAVTMDFSAFGGGASVAATNSSGTWTATYTVVSGAIDGTNKNVAVTATDDAGNTATTADTTNATVDNQAPTVTDGNISVTSTGSGTGGTFITGDTVTVEWSNAGDGNSDIAAAFADFIQFGGGPIAMTDVNSDGALYRASYTLTAGSIDGANLNTSVMVTDDAGNTATSFDFSNLSVDNQAPTVTDANLSISGATGTGGAFIVGDTVTATWNNTAGGDNNSDIASVTLDFSAFGGGAAVVATNSSGTWTAAYTITENGGGTIDATGLNVSATATDDAGNSTTTADTTGATVDNVSPGTLTGTLAACRVFDSPVR
jgi:hypothetical protein